MKPTCKLTGTNGNIFALMSRCAAALKRADQEAQAMEMIHQISNNAHSYDEALRIMMDYCEVE